MITDENDPRMQKAVADIQERMRRLCVGRAISEEMLSKVRQLIYDHRTSWRHRGVDFPRMVVLTVPRLGAIDLVRADLDLPGIRIVLMNFLTLHPGVTKMELYIAAKAAFPKPPSGFVDEARAWLDHQKEKSAARAEASRNEEDEDRQAHFLKSHGLPPAPSGLDRRDH